MLRQVLAGIARRVPMGLAGGQGRGFCRLGAVAYLRLGISTLPCVCSGTRNVGWQCNWAPWVVLVPPLPSQGLPFTLQ